MRADRGGLRDPAIDSASILTVDLETINQRFDQWRAGEGLCPFPCAPGAGSQRPDSTIRIYVHLHAHTRAALQPLIHRQLVPLDLLAQRDLFQHLVRAIHLIIDNHDIVPALDGIPDLAERRIQPEAERVVRLGPAAAQARAQRVDRRRCEEEEEGIEVRVVGLDQLDALRVDVEDAPPVEGRDGCDGCSRRSVAGAGRVSAPPRVPPFPVLEVGPTSCR